MSDHRARITKRALEATILRTLHQVQGCHEARSIGIHAGERTGDWSLGTCDFGTQTTACVDELKKIVPALKARFVLGDEPPH